MAKKESTLMNMVLTLFLVALVASTALGYIYELTKEPIARAKLAKKTMAIQQVVPAFDNNPIDDMYKIPIDEGTDSLEAYPAKMNGTEVGTAIRSYSKNGFSGMVWLMVGFSQDGEINNISVLEHKETPGLGTKMDDPAFKDQFKGIDPLESNIKVKKDGGEVDAITAATISSRAFSQAVEKAAKAYAERSKP
ncbi:MAG: RnfABCDGE type electron transport complex subunit G [Candidatus Cyclobacteriaceae bacterium M3_2C_046]